MTLIVPTQNRYTDARGWHWNHARVLLVSSLIVGRSSCSIGLLRILRALLVVLSNNAVESGQASAGYYNGTAFGRLVQEDPVEDHQNTERASCEVPRHTLRIPS